MHHAGCRRHPFHRIQDGDTNNNGEQEDTDGIALRVKATAQLPKNEIRAKQRTDEHQHCHYDGCRYSFRFA
jgi:hypothetical protein